jgi:hypothetical protein
MRELFQQAHEHIHVLKTRPLESSHEHNKISSPVTELGKPDPLPDPRRSQNCDARVESVGAELRKVKKSIVAHICS